EHSMLGAAHALANPLTATYGIPHGHAVALMLPHVVRFNAACCAPWYEELLQASAGLNGAPAPAKGAHALADFVTQMARAAKLPICLAEVGVEEARLPQLSVEAAKQWTGTFNPRRLRDD